MSGRPVSASALHAGDEEVEIVEGVLDAEAHEPALRRVRVDVVEMPEAGRVFRLAEERVRVAPFRLARAGGGRRRDGEKRRERGAEKPCQMAFPVAGASGGRSDRGNR